MNLNTVWSRTLCAVLACAAVLAVDLWQRPLAPAQAHAIWPAMPVGLRVEGLVLAAHGHMPMPANTPAAHASTLVAMPAGQGAALTAFWFSGERESGPNVQIAASQFDRATQRWSEARFVVNRDALGAQLGFGVRRLGNPVAWMDGSGRIHLFVVATGWGGWAASRILHLRQSSAGSSLPELAFESLGLLPMSWLWNTSHLVRNAPLPLADGGMLLPAHFELGIKYPVALRFDRHGDFVGLSRISRRNYALQPTLLANTPTEWVALMRDERHEGRVVAARTANSGRTWEDLPDLALLNPDSSVGGLALAPGQSVLAHNSSPGSRATLTLSRSSNGIDWSPLHTVASGSNEDEYSYPALLWADDSLWVSYTVDRQTIDWQRYSAQPISAPIAAPIPQQGSKP